VDVAVHWAQKVPFIYSESKHEATRSQQSAL